MASLRLFTCLACACVLVLTSGCGETDQEQARDVVQSYVDARAASDYAGECDLYSPAYKRELGVGVECPAFVEEQSSGLQVSNRFDIVDVRVTGERALADIDIEGEAGPARITLTLTRDTEGIWLISGFG